VGRVDLTDLPMYGISDTLLHKRYLDKNHQFRHLQITAAERGFIVDNFDTYGEAFASAAGGASPPCSRHPGPGGAVRVLAVGDRLLYLWSYGCGSATTTMSAAWAPIATLPPI